jgi:hypothetical protein
LAISINKNGLIFYVDADIKESYPRTGSIWRNLIATNDGSIINTQVFNNNYFTFTPVAYTEFADDIALNTNTPSVEVWMRTNSPNQSGHLFEKGYVNTQYSLFLNGSNEIYWRQSGYQDLKATTSNFITAGLWHQIVGTYTSGDKRIYVNGDLAVSTDTITGTIATDTTGIWVGVYGGGGGYRYEGDLAIVRVYNKALTLSEVLQNYNATKYRFQ